MIEFFVHGVPAPKGSARGFVVNGRALITNDCKRAKPWQQEVAMVALLNKPEEVWEGPVRLDVQFILPRPTATSKKARGLRHAKRPDRDKLLRVIQDALRGIFYGDDGQVSDGATSKVVADPGQPTGVLIRVGQLPKEVA